MILRPATMKDAELLFKWRNDSGTRQQSIAPGEIVRSVHRRWLLTHAGELFIAMERRRPVGVIRLSRATGEVHLTVAPQCRGRGYGTMMLRLIVDQAREWKLLRVWGQIKNGNQASRMVFFWAGFDEMMVVAERVL